MTVFRANLKKKNWTSKIKEERFPSRANLKMGNKKPIFDVNALTLQLKLEKQHHEAPLSNWVDTILEPVPVFRAAMLFRTIASVAVPIHQDAVLTMNFVHYIALATIYWFSPNERLIQIKTTENGANSIFIHLIFYSCLFGNLNGTLGLWEKVKKKYKNS